MCGNKAIVLATGEIVTINNQKDKNDDIVYTILEDVHREFIADELRIIENKWDFIAKWHPDYNCDEVAFSDDIECCLSGEAEEDRLETTEMKVTGHYRFTYTNKIENLINKTKQS